eukprot:TRINITY_DN5582_c0_g1_i4.p1 TRINITY_DN5582_c0_g1~~TRINITY_DN5582_c0_g1_i4.p1  ORF type:complete len:114 (+),score=14.84 TRINITY_DN5582_c0_g1_i4:771-1112(+)
MQRGYIFSLSAQGKNFFHKVFFPLFLWNSKGDKKTVLYHIPTTHNPDGKKVLVHCSGGVSRSPSVVIAYLMALNGMSYGEAHAEVKRKRNGVKPNPTFQNQLKRDRISLILSP